MHMLDNENIYTQIINLQHGFPPLGYMGLSCNVRDPCVGVDCGHGTCSASSTNPSGYTCTCQRKYTGTHCTNREQRKYSF